MHRDLWDCIRHMCLCLNGRFHSGRFGNESGTTLESRVKKKYLSAVNQRDEAVHVCSHDISFCHFYLLIFLMTVVVLKE